jgi:hypothetical protein
MYGKSFKMKYTGSMVGAGPIVFAVWDYMIAHAEDGTVDVNPTVVAAAIGKMAEQDVEDALCWLNSPDEKSRSKEEGGRRIVQVGPLQWRLVNWELYRGLHRSEQKRSQDRERQKRWRADKLGAKAASVTKRDKPLRNAKPRRVAAPLPADWAPNDGHRELAEERHANLLDEVANFRDHAASVGRETKDWDAAFRSWLRKARSRHSYASSGAPAPQTATERQIERARRLLAEEAAAKAAGGQA